MILQARDERVAIESVYLPHTNFNSLGKFQEYKYGVANISLSVYPCLPVPAYSYDLHSSQPPSAIMTLSTAMTITARVAVTGLLSVSCFKRTVVDNTAQVLSKAEKASAGLVVYSVCLSTITLVLAADKAAQRILGNEPKYRPATSKDDNDDSLPSINDTTTSLAPQPVEPSHLQPFLSPSQSHLIEPAETISVPIYTCTPNEKTTVEPYYLQSSLNSSLLRLIESTEITSAPITGSNICTPCITLTSPDLSCKRLSIDSSTTLVPHEDNSVTHVFSDDDASDANDCESFCDENTIHEVRHSISSNSTLPDVRISRTIVLNYSLRRTMH